MNARPLCVGTVVYDHGYEMVGVVAGFNGRLVVLRRPAGITWEARYQALRPGTAYEHRQLRALARLARQQRKGLVYDRQGTFAR